MRHGDDAEKTKHNIYLFKGDYEELASIYPDFPPAVVIRNLVRNHIRNLNKGKVPKLVTGVEI